MDDNQAQVVVAFLRRNWWILLQSLVVVAGVAAYLTVQAPASSFRASAVVLVRPDRDAENYGVAPYLAAEQRLATNATIAAAVAGRVGGANPAALRRAVSAVADERTLTLTFTTRDPDADRAVALANAWATSYIETTSGKQTAQLQARADDLGRQLADLDAQLAQLDAQSASALTEPEKALASASRESLARRYDTLFTAQSELLNTILAEPEGARLIGPAEVASRPASPSVVRRGVLGAVAGLLLGIGIAVLRELLRDRLRDRADAEQLTGLPLLAELPAVRPRLSGLPAVHEPSGAFAEAIRTMRTSVRFLGALRPLQVVAVTSATPSEGKTTVAANLAVSFAQGGMVTVLVSGDLRAPGLDPLFGVTGRPGLTDLLYQHASGQHLSMVGKGATPGQHLEALIVDVGAYLQPTLVANLKILPAGSHMPNARELLDREASGELFKAIHHLADVVVIDTSPLVVSDSMLVARAADGVVLVAAVGRTRRNALQEATARLMRADMNILGVVVNLSRNNRHAARYYGYGHLDARDKQRRRGT